MQLTAAAVTPPAEHAARRPAGAADAAAADASSICGGGLQVKIVVIEVLEGNISIIKCPACDGTGGRDWSNWHKPCGGTGVLAIQHEGPLVICSGCEGTGGRNWSSWHSACGGTGVVPAYGSWKILPREQQK